MPSATASGADAGANGNARSRDHNQGNQERKYTLEQKAAVIRIRRCNATAFYEILDIESVRSTCSDGDIKKAYRKQSLLTHPDKNGHEHADEAFKMVSRAFGVLGDKEKREKYDRFGTDPDSRFESARAQNPFSGGGFPGRAASGGMGGNPFGGGGQFEAEMSPEEMFQRFFGGGFGGPFGGFDTGPQFVFNIGGNRGFRVHQMGGAGPRRRPREAGPNGQQQPQTPWDMLVSSLPIIFLVLFPLLTSIFSGSESQPAMPSVVFDAAQAPNTFERTTPRHGVHYYVDPREVAGWTDYKLKQLDNYADNTFVRHTRYRCENEMRTKQHLYEQAQGWFFQDPEKVQVARDHPMQACDRLDKLGIQR